MKQKGILLVLSMLLIFSCLVGCGGADQKIIVSSKNFTESIILGEIFAQMIESHTDLKVERKLNINNFVVFEGLKKGDVDLYPEYTGTAYMAHLKLNLVKDTETGEIYSPDEIYDIVKEKFDQEFQITWLGHLGFNNTYAIAVKEAFAEKNNLTEVSDLIPLSNQLTFGAEHDFFDREDGYPGLIKKYGLQFKDTRKMEVSLKYEAIAQDKMQVTNAYSTDGQLIKYNLRILEDNKQFFPPYYPAPIIRTEILDKHPKVADVLNKLANQITEEEMQQLNYKAEVEKKEIADVAEEFLKAKDLIQ